MAAELLHVDLGHQASPVFTTIQSFLNISDTSLVQLISIIIAASACKFEGLQTDVYPLHTEHLLLSKQTLEYSHIFYWRDPLPHSKDVHFCQADSTFV